MTSSPDDRLWTRDFVLANAANFFQAMIFYLLMTSMALYAVDRFGASDVGAGAASSAYIAGAVVARLFAGKTLDVVGRRRQFLLALGAAFVISFLYFPLTSLPALIAVRVVHGIAFGVGSTTISAAVQAIIPPWRRGEGTGYFGMSATIATAIGPALAVQLTQHLGYDSLFWASVVCAGLGLVFAFLLRLPEPGYPATKAAATEGAAGTDGTESGGAASGGAARARRRRFPRPTLAGMIEPEVVPASLTVALLGACHSTILAFLQPTAVQRGLENPATLFFLVFAVFALATRVLVGRVQDRRGDNAVVYVLLTLYAAGLVTLALAQDPWLLYVSGALCGLGFGGIVPCFQAITVALVPASKVGVATSTFFIALDVGTAAGAIVLGGIVTWVGYKGMFLAAAGIVVFAVLVYYFGHGRRPEARTPRATLRPS